MASIDLIERITTLFAEGRHEDAINVLNQEVVRLKNLGKMTAAKKLQAVIKKVPSSTNKFYAVSSDNVKTINFSTNKNNSLVEKYRSKVTPEQVVLNASVKSKIEDLFKEWDDIERLTKHNLFPTNKLLFYGPPGTGKTLLANAIANHLDFPLVLVRLDELVSSFLGETGKNIREIFEMASNEPVVLFIDEIDTVAKFRSDEKELGELKRIVTVLLQHIDFFPQTSLIIGATNHDEILDKAIWRRFPLKIRLDLPDDESRRLLFKLYLNNVDHTVDIDLISQVTEGLNGSEIFDIVQTAKKQSVLTGSDKVTTTIVAKAFLSVANAEKLNKGLSKKITYELCQELKNSGYKLREIEAISGIAYTTLRDNLK